MDREQAKQIIVETIQSVQGCKGTELITKVAENNPEIFSGDWSIPELVEDLVNEERVAEIEYSLPGMEYRAKSFYLPAQTNVTWLRNVHRGFDNSLKR
jgi:hypothetical protein